jgi:hypothetical protein
MQWHIYRFKQAPADFGYNMPHINVQQPWDRGLCPMLSEKSVSLDKN